MKKFLIIFEKTKTVYSAYSPDLPGCVAAGLTKKETENLIQEAIEFHIEGLIEEGLEIPDSSIKKAAFYKIGLKNKISKLAVI